MYTYQDLVKVADSDAEKIEFIRNVISSHKNSDMYEQAKIAQQYYDFKNVTIIEFQKLLYTVTGKVIPDNFSANYKLRSNFFYRFMTHQNQFLLSNGVQWQKSTTSKQLGGDFDEKLQKAGLKALIGAVSFGFWNNDHVDVFSILEFAPLWDEEDGSLKSGVRFWQIDSTKPLRATLYELDGYTDYIWRNGEEVEILNPKRPYKLKIVTSEVDGSYIKDGENYDSFPIVPLWGNPSHQSEIEGLRENIDAYDLIKSGFANSVDEASFIYWAIQGAGGMGDMDLAKFVERMKTLHAAMVEDEGARAEAHTIEAPYASREALLSRLRNDMYEDAMALDTKNIAGGAITATQIRAAYEELNCKVDQYEYCIIDFIKAILKLAGIDDIPTFTRSMLVNKQEEVQTVVSGGSYLDPSYVTEKILTILGDGDKAEEMIKQIDANEINPLGESMNGEEDNYQFR